VTPIGPLALGCLSGIFMAHVLITSGPTRQYLDPVRYLTNASSGRMGQALAQAALDAGHQVTIVSGPVELSYPAGVRVISVVTTDDMLAAARDAFRSCAGAIGVAAPCDYRPVHVQEHKMSKTGEPLTLQLLETPDVIAELGRSKHAGQWVVGFALETTDHRFRALRKLEQKHCDLIVVNSPSAMHASDTQVEVLNQAGDCLLRSAGSKTLVAVEIWALIERQLIHSSKGDQ
jgi:phosphopantothenoylcysteine decarboxylase/phosphopantothenate--cysteine ligase